VFTVAFAVILPVSSITFEFDEKKLFCKRKREKRESLTIMWLQEKQKGNGIN